MKLSTLQIIALIALKTDLSKIPEGSISPVALPSEAKFAGNNEIKTDEDFLRLLGAWDGMPVDLEGETQEEGDFGLDRDGVVHVLTPDGWHLLSEFADIHLCPKCYSDNIFTLEWININTGRKDKNLKYEDTSTWCIYCNSLTGMPIPLVHLHKKGGQDGNNTTSEVSKDSPQLMV